MLKKLLISEVRINLLKILLPNPDRQFHIRALVREVDAEINAVRRELNRLEDIGLLIKRKSSNRVYYTVDTAHPFYSDLLALVGKEIGLGAAVIKYSKQLGNVKFAVLATEFLKGRESSVLDVDLLIVGSVHTEVLKKIVSDQEKLLKREINYTVMPEDDFLHRKRRNDNFVAKFMAQSRTMLIGDETKFCEI